MSGSYNDIYKDYHAEIGSNRFPYTEKGYTIAPKPYENMITGSAVAPSFSSDDLWERMYIRPKPVIIICGACGSHNTISNPTCVQCGAPMSWGKEKTYG